MASTNAALRTMVQSCGVVRLPNFLCRDSIAAVLRVQAAYRAAYGEPGPCRPNVVTAYLSTDDLFRRTEPALFERLRSLRRCVDPAFVRGSDALLAGQPARWRGLESLSLRCIELHTTAPGGNLASATHCDSGSTVTVDVLIDDGFTGGEFETPSCTAPPSSSSHAAATAADGGDARAAPPALSARATQLKAQAAEMRRDPDAVRAAVPDMAGMTDAQIRASADNIDRMADADDGPAAPRAAPIRFGLGDAIIFPSYKYHSVRPVTGGCRKTLVLEFWTGVERHCDHRCPQPTGRCDHTARRDVWGYDGLFD